MEPEKKVAPWINAVQMLPGRVHFTMDGVLALLDRPAEANLVPLITAAKDAAVVQVEVEANWMQNRGIQPTRPEAQKLDVSADREVVNLHGPIARASKNFKDYKDIPDEDLDEEQLEERTVQGQSTAIIKAHTLEGVTAITGQIYEEQLLRMKQFVATLRKPEHNVLVRVLGLAIYLRRLEKLIPEYERALRSVKHRAVTWTETRAAKAATHEAFCQVIGAILNLPEPARARLLPPIEDQQKRTREARAAKVRIKDLDLKDHAEVDPPDLRPPEDESTEVTEV